MITSTMRELRIARRISVWHIAYYQDAVQWEHMSEQTSSKIHLATWRCAATQIFSLLQETV
jgi:hypothetical protein